MGKNDGPCCLEHALLTLSEITLFYFKMSHCAFYGISESAENVNGTQKYQKVLFIMSHQFLGSIAHFGTLTPARDCHGDMVTLTVTWANCKVGPFGSLRESLEVS